MPNLQNAKKALRQAKTRAVENKRVKDGYKDALRAIRKALEAGETKLEEKVTTAQKALDKAVKRGVIKPNNAARKKSRMMTKVNAATSKK